MKKLKMKILVLFLVFLNNLYSETLEMNLATFATYTSEVNNINILIDDDLKNENIIFIINDKESYMLEAFRRAVNLKGLELVQTEKFYFVTKKDLYVEDLKYRSIKLNFVKYEDIQNFLKVYEDRIKYEFISTSKTLLIYSKEKEFNSIKQMIGSIDTLPKQLKLKVTILETNLDKLKELGSDSSSINLQNDGNFFFNLVSYPFTVKNSVDSSKKDNFYTFLKYLNSENVSEFVSSPILTLSDEKPSSLKIGDRIPYQMGSTTINDTALRTSNSYEYQEVGLYILVTPHMYSNNNVYIDLQINVSSVKSNENNLPITSQKSIIQPFHLKVNELYVLTGINKKDLVTSYNEIPILADIPLLGWLFKYDSKQETKNNLTVVFELIEENEFDTKNFNVLVPNKLN
jgi:general secretion pathway protein D